MKTLRRFWDWNRHEKPTADLAGAMLQKNLSPNATLAVIEAQRLIAQVTRPREGDWPALLPALERLSLELCATYDEVLAIEKQRAQ